MSDIADQIERTDNEYKKLEQDATGALQAIADNTAKTSKQLDQYAGQVDKAAKKTKEAEQETGRFSRGLKTLFGNLSVGGVSLNDLSDSLQSLKGGLKDVGSSSQGAAKDAAGAAKGFGVLRLGALALVAVVGAALVAAFSKFQGNLDKVRVGLAQGKIALDIGITALGKWGNQLIQAATGQKSLRDAVRDASAETADFNIQIRQQIALEGKLETQRIGLERQKQEQTATAALRKQEIEQLNLIADNTTKSFAVREAAAKRRAALSEQQAKADEKRILTEIGLNARISGGQEQQIKSSKQIVALSKEGTLTTEILAKRIEQSGISQAEAFKRATQIFAQIGELGDAQETLLGIQSEAFNQAQSIRAEQSQAAAAEKQRIEGLQKSIQDLLTTTTEARVKLGDENDGIQLQFANATAEVERLRAEYTKLAKELGTGETAQDIERLFKPLQDIADIDFERASFGKSLEVVTGGLERLLKAATDPVTGNITDLVSSQTAKPLAERLRADGLEAGKALAGAITQGQSLEAARQKEKGNEAAKQLIGQLAPEAINAFFEAEQARFELRIAQQDALIGKINERLEVEKKALEEQQKLADEGLANDLDGAKKRVAEQERLLRDSENKKLDIERKAANQRKIIAAGQQAVELTLAVAKLISAEASKGLIGLVLAVGGLAIISRLVAAGRSQAASEAGRTQNFATGTERVRGEGTWTSDSVPVNLSKDERVLKSSDNARLGFERMSNKQLVHYALLGQRVHSDPLFAFAMGLRGQQSKLEESKLSLQVDVMKDAYKEAALMAADKQIDYWRTRPIQYRNDAGEMVTEWKEGNRVVRQIDVIGEVEVITP
ncbi:hypothetical protein [Brevundimonas sp.]|uniref:hypothetical protein n=1 Tax=Brevundimonas sp. TaxID=1871086 RepID=UPI0037848283